MNTPGAVPRPLSSLVGRRREVADLTRLLAERRLVTLVGPGGAGKTRLAVEVATILAARSDQPPVFVDLSPLSSAATVVPQVAGALGIAEQPRRPLIDTLAERCPEGALLIVLDNCEHVFAAAVGVAARLLEVRPALQVLATSRQPLGIPGEVTWPVPPLAAPAPGQEAEPFDAVHLFVDRASARRPGYHLTPGSGPLVGEICRRLDGIPLAIELAAAWVATLGEAEILARVTGDLALLGRPSTTTTSPRHQTMAAAIAWSHALLDPREQALFRGLGVFAGGFVLEAVEGVLGPLAVQPLAALVDKSLVVATTTPEAPTRFRLLEVVRRFAVDLLASDPGADRYRQAHAAYYVTLADLSEAAQATAGAPGWMRRLTEERDNLRAALEWLLVADPPSAVRLAGALGWFWQSSGPTEGVQWLDRVLATPTPRDEWRARALEWAGWLRLRMGDPVAFEARLQECHAIAVEIQSPIGRARALSGLTISAHMLHDDLPGARRMCEEALALARAAGDDRVTGGLLNNLGGLALAEGDAAGAISSLQEGLTVHRRSGNPWGTANISLFLAYALQKAGRGDEAWVALLESLTLSESLADRSAIGSTLELMSLVGGPLDDAARLRLAAAGVDLMEKEGTGRPPFWVADAVAWRESARSAMGTRWERLWADGSSMSLEIALRIARGAAALESHPDGWDRLSRREREVVALVAEGLSNREIAERLFISERTAESHVGAILTRLGFRSRAQIASWAASGH